MNSKSNKDFWAFHPSPQSLNTAVLRLLIHTLVCYTVIQFFEHLFNYKRTYAVLQQANATVHDASSCPVYCLKIYGDGIVMGLWPLIKNPLAPSDPYMGRTAQLTSRRYILNNLFNKYAY
jgi:hypothetical protein